MFLAQHLTETLDVFVYLSHCCQLWCPRTDNKLGRTSSINYPCIGKAARLKVINPGEEGGTDGS